METLSTNIILIVIFALVFVFLVVIETVTKNNKTNHYYDNSENQNTNVSNKQVFNDNNDKLERRLKVEYWKRLEKIYDKKSTDTLNKAKAILENMQSLHTNGSFTAKDFHDVDEWYCSLGELRVLLDFPIWGDDDTNPKEYTMPLFVDLDIKYINELLEERNLKSQRKYY